MAHSMVDALLAGHRVSKHDGPGLHEGTKTPQTVHAGKGPSGWASWLNSLPWKGISEAQVQASNLDDAFYGVPGWQRFKAGVMDWAQGGQRTSRLLERLDRGGADDPLVWRPEDPERHDNIRLLGRVVAKAPHNAPELYRGITLKGVSPEDFKGMFTEGAEFSDVGLGSWTSDRDFASRWANPRFAEDSDMPVVFILKQGSQALNVSPLSEIPEQKEWITGGRFRVRRVDSLSGRVWLSQVEGPTQHVRKRDDSRLKRRIAVMLSGRPDALYEVSKHMGPGPHPGTGTEQDEHAGGQPGADAGAIRSPWGLDAMPEHTQKLLDRKLEALASEGYDLSPDAISSRLKKWFGEARKDPEVFDAGMSWYKDARNWIRGMAGIYELDPRSATGITATLSARTDWEVNKMLAHKLVMILDEDELGGNEFIKKRKLSSLSPDEVYTLIDLGVINPSTGYEQGHGSQFVIPAIRMFRGEDPDIIGGPKLRSFFNNLWLPDQRTSFTVDTHMMRMFLDDSDISGTKAQSIFTSSPNTYADRPDHPDHWKWGLHGYAQEQGSRTADELGVLPHQLQAVTWTEWVRRFGSSKRGKGIGGEQRERGIVRG